MKQRIDIETLSEFGRELNILRKFFPEFAREIDQCFFAVGQNHAKCCGEKDCGCQISFEDFHAARNKSFAAAKNNRKDVL